MDIEEIGYFLFMESQEQKNKGDNGDEETKNHFKTRPPTQNEKARPENFLSWNTPPHIAEQIE